MKKRRLLGTIFLFFLIVCAILIINWQRDTPYQTAEGTVFGTYYKIVYQSDKDLRREIESTLASVDTSLSTFNKQSVISKINSNESMQTNKMFRDVFMLAEQISKDTDGAFDVTVAPLVNAWGFGFKTGAQPTKHVVDSLRGLVGYDKVTLVNGEVHKADSRIMLDCSAIAKGYGCDEVARMLLSKDLTNFMIDIGGEIVTRGISSKRIPWKIGINKPIDDTLSTKVAEIQTVLNVTDKAMATSGNYRNFYYKGGKKYAHTIDPHTGYPVQHSLLSATVIAPNCATADAYATSFMVMGLEKAEQALSRHEDMMAYFIYQDTDGSLAVWYSPSMKKILR